MKLSKSVRTVIAAIAVAVLSFTASADTTREVTFTVSPKMSCANCEKKIKTNLRFEKGVKKINTSIPAQKVNITYNPEKTSEESLVKALKKIGYDATVVKAAKNSEASSSAVKSAKNK